jgi:hypothetical protein
MGALHACPEFLSRPAIPLIPVTHRFSSNAMAADVVWSAVRFRARYLSFMMVPSPLRRRNRLIAHRAFRRLSSQRQTVRRVEQRGVDRRGAALRLLRRRLAPIRPFPKHALVS